MMHYPVSDDSKKISWQGKMTDDNADFDVIIHYLEDDGNIPKSSILKTSLVLSRFVDGSSSNPEGCKQIRWVSRAVINLHSAGAEMVMVPVCM